jgi:outer membrane lipoprotein-sorting protein
MRHRLSAAFAAILTLAPAAPALAQSATAALPPADLALVNKATAYLNSLKDMQGRFEQVSPRGATSTGDLYLSRPGKARFQYDPPSGLVVVADGRRVSVSDSRLKTFNSAPLAATPLAVLLAPRVRLDQDVDVTRVGRLRDGFYLTARKTSGQAQTEGSITMEFGNDPVVLRGWTLVDGQGQATKVQVTGLKAQALDPNLFVLNDTRPADENGQATKLKAAKGQ